MSPTYLIDTSAWIEYLRKTGSDTHLFVRELLSNDAEVTMTEPVILEVLAGAKGPDEAELLEQLVDGLPLLTVDNRLDYHAAARLYRDVRSRGRTVRKLLDCLIAVVALRADAVLVHNDRDFDHIAAVFPRLRTQRHNRG